MAVFQNQATITFGGVTRASNIATGEIVEAVGAVKTSLLPTYTPGGIVTYVIGIRNTGDTPLTGITVTDDLGSYDAGGGTVEKITVVPLTYVEGSAAVFSDGTEQTGVTATVTGGSLVVTGISVPAGGSAVLVYETTANEYAPLGADAQITNNASVTGTGVTDTVTASATVTASDAADLGITKSVNPAVVTGNSRITYTFEVQNTGAATTAEDGVVIQDTFNPVLSDLVVTLNGETLTDAQYTYDPVTGVFATNDGVLTIPGAVYAQDPTTGVWTTEPGTAVLTVSGVI